MTTEKFSINAVQFDDKCLVPAIVQDIQTGEVLMLAYMNKEALTKTIDTQETWFYSRSRQELWHKGATSGNRQKLKRLTYDCDQDAILAQVEPLGPACHTGTTSCFTNVQYEVAPVYHTIINQVVERIQHRRDNPVEGSYTSYLFREGIDKVLKKVGEESSEVIIGAKNNDKPELTSELADLVYHTLVLMNIQNVSLEDIQKELQKRYQ